MDCGIYNQIEKVRHFALHFSGFPLRVLLGDPGLDVAGGDHFIHGLLRSLDIRIVRDIVVASRSDRRAGDLVVLISDGPPRS